LMSSLQGRMERSKRRFQNIVWPEVSGWFGGGELIAVEKVSTELAECLDTEAGIDWLAKVPGRGVIAIASRVQRGRCFETTTVRYELSSGNRTEFEKRMMQLRRGMVVPTVTVHSYVELDDPLDKRCTSGELLNAAIHQTAPLYNFLAEAEEGEEPDKGEDAWDINGQYYLKRNGQDDTTFLVAPWAELLSNVPTRVHSLELLESVERGYQAPLRQPAVCDAYTDGGGSR